MNQILITEKVYVTPELKRKKKVYKFDFFLSIFLVCILFSYYIYAEYDRNKSEETSKSILDEVNTQLSKKDDTIIKPEDSILLVYLDEPSDEVIAAEEETPPEPAEVSPEMLTAPSGYQYYSIGVVNIPKIDVEYPILSEFTDELLKIAPNYFWGAKPNEVGNFCIVGHNYRNRKFFSKVPTLENGDIIEITDLKGKTLKYAVYDKFTVNPDQLDCTSQKTGGKKEVTLITCTNDSQQRVIVKAREIV